MVWGNMVRVEEERGWEGIRTRRKAGRERLRRWWRGIGEMGWIEKTRTET